MYAKTRSGNANQLQNASNLRLVHNSDPTDKSTRTARTTSPTEARRAHVRAQLESHVSGSGGAIAAAVAAIQADGAIDLLLVGIEPEHAARLADGLDTLSERLRAHSRTRGRQRRERGRILLPFLTTLSFAGLTYLNDVAWLDLVLSIGSQITAQWLTARSFTRR